MKIHQPILVGSSQTSASLDTEGVITSSAVLIQTSIPSDEDLFLVKGLVNEGEVMVNDKGNITLKWSGSAPPPATEGGIYYSASSFYIGT
tara:strand:- start:238 stop:507 length:270 start_codon:yes stop_codon:yes gene_type:complete